MRVTMAFASLRRHQLRTALAVAGIAVSAAMLLDMVMLSSGMRESFRSLLQGRGFQLRLSPRGTLPFDTEATVGGATALLAEVQQVSGVTAVAPVLGAQLYVPRDGGARTTVALGLDPKSQGDYDIATGRDITTADECVASASAVASLGLRVGDTLAVAFGYDPQLRTFTGRRTLRVVGTATFAYLATEQPAIAMELPTLQAMGGSERTDRVSMVMVRSAPGANEATVAAAIEQRIPRVTALTTAAAVKQADERLAYFRNLAVILGAVSLTVGFLLVTTLMTVSVNERIGEIAVQRAIGVRAARLVQQITLEGLALSFVGSTLGLGLGLITARYLNAILSTFPGLPPGIDFFLFQPSAAFKALGMLVVAGALAGIYPSWRASKLPIASTLREEAVA